MVVDTFRYYAGAPERLMGDTIPVAGGQAFTVREPLGVVGLIVPWNFPLTIAAWKLGAGAGRRQHGRAQARRADAADGAALRAAGARGRDRAGRRERRRRARARWPAHGSSSIPDVAKIAFTGSTEVGRTIAASAAQTIKRVTLELGGKSANIIFADADLEKAAAAAPWAVFDNAGQDCCARSRLLVEASVADRFLACCEPHVEGFKVGDPLDPDSRWGR